MAPLDPTDLLDLYWAGRTHARHPARPDPGRTTASSGGSSSARATDLPEPLRRSRCAARAAGPGACCRCRRPSPARTAREEHEARLGLRRLRRGRAARPRRSPPARRRSWPPLRRIMRTHAADAAAPPDPPDGVGAAHGRAPGPAAHGARDDAHCTASRPSCSGAARRLRAAAADPHPRRVRARWPTTRATCCSSPTPPSAAADRVEVFCFGTRLTRITRELEHRRPDEALDRAAEAVFDWEGGTRIGDSLDAFVRDWGRRGLCRGGIVVICSDGLDRGDPERAGDRDGAAVPAVPPDRLDEPAQGRSTRTSGRARSG